MPSPATWTGLEESSAFYSASPFVSDLESENGFGWQAMLMGYGCGVIFGMLMGYLMFKIGKPQWIVRTVKSEQNIMLRRLKKNAQRHGGKNN